ncbi:hybrid sensor histidine kinase/response regulator [Lysinibacillus piscis]|uniref:histidine kinase n=1 Tax=Lysinibacillus piscis TaxID=2518931 RepID=A0ABQ5NPX1_9BACI|nr:ATP-binding protein [Lysinibacillus sp. KH24]GLC90172.1 hypothetical protein LYSBPC_32990 [Lysinibacillus sp. KH24]
MKKLLLLFIIIISTISIAVVVFFVTHPTSDGPQAVKGVMDLRHYTFHNNTSVKLDGEWEFVPNKLVSSSEFDAYDNYVVKVPSAWTQYTTAGEKMPAFASGTYRLKILIKDVGEILGIKTNIIRMSNALYINDELVGQSGQPDENANYVPHNTPYTTYFSPKTQELELIVHVANFDYAPGGGIISSLFLGDQYSIKKLREGALFYDLITFAAFLTMFIYFLGSYLYAKLDIEQLYFAFFCLASVLYTLTHGEKLLLSFADISYAPFQSIQMASSVSVGFTILLYFYRALPKYMDHRVVKILSTIGIIMMLTMLLPATINSRLQDINSLYVFANIVYIFYAQIIAIYQRATGVMYLLLSSLAVFLYFIVATFNTHINLELNALPPLLPFVCLTMLSLYISHRFADSYLEKGKLTEALIRVDKLKDDFLAKTSHEFRTPLHGIVAISQSMLDSKEEKNLTKEQKEKVSLIFSISERLSHLVNDILDFSKLKEGELKLHITSVDLFSVTHLIVEIVSYLVSKDVVIDNRIERGQFVLADENRLRQILYNLINNAVKYTNHGKIEISCYEENGFLAIEVKDTGRGIAIEYLETIFEPFQQLENATDGTGLGLSVTKELVQLQGGDITVQSTIGQGTTFCVKLPLGSKHYMEPVYKRKKKIENTKPSLTFPHIVKNKGQRKIIIVDDDHINLRVLIDILEKENYYIIAVDNGEHVFEQLAKHHDVDLLILDIMMPNLSGYEVCQLVRNNYSSAELPILMLTAAIRPEDMVAAFQSGANDFLHKPLDTTELKTRVRNLLLLKESTETAVKMETAFLQAQIKPHFVYNVLNSILSLSYLDLEKTRSMITDFATFLRNSFAFENANSLVPLEKELNLIKAYVNIHRTRYPEQLEWAICMDEPIQCLIPPLLLQPLVENALLHGLKTKNSEGQLKLVIKKEQQMVVFQVIDNGSGIPQELLRKLQKGEITTSQGIGIRNISKRLKKFEHATIWIESIHNKGTTVEIKFPIIMAERI